LTQRRRGGRGAEEFRVPDKWRRGGAGTACFRNCRSGCISQHPERQFPTKGSSRSWRPRCRSASRTPLRLCLLCVSASSSCSCSCSCSCSWRCGCRSAVRAILHSH